MSKPTRRRRDPAVTTDGTGEFAVRGRAEDELTSMTLGLARYLGGLARFPSTERGLLVLDRRQIGVGGWLDTQPAVAWAEVAGVDLERDPRAISHRAGADAQVRRALKAKSARGTVLLLVHTSAGETAYFQLLGTPGEPGPAGPDLLTDLTFMLARINRWLVAMGVRPILEAPPEVLRPSC